MQLIDEAEFDSINRSPQASKPNAQICDVEKCENVTNENIYPIFPSFYWCDDVLTIPIFCHISISCFFLFIAGSLMEGINLLVSSGTASAIAGDRLCMVKRKTARDDTKVWLFYFLTNWDHWQTSTNMSTMKWFPSKNSHNIFFLFSFQRLFQSLYQFGS